MPLRYRAVIFDLDGTLVDSYAAITIAMNHTLLEHGFAEMPESQIRGYVGEGLEKLLERVFAPKDVPASALQVFDARYGDICCAESRALEDVHSTLMTLDQLGLAMAVCTNKPTVFSVKILEHLELAPFFRAIVGPDLAGARKPDPQHVLYAMHETRCTTSESLFVGDMPIDIRAARNSGLDVAVVATGSAPEDELRAANPDHFLDRFSDLIRIVNGVAA